MINSFVKNSLPIEFRQLLNSFSRKYMKIYAEHT